MKYCLLLLIAVKSLFVHGFGFHANMPFQMEFELPAFPQMNAMPFPPIFNPAEAMQRETMDPDTRGMDIDEAMGNITTKNKTELKDGFKVTTITRDGPGFHSYIKEYENEGNGTGNGSSGIDMAKMMGGSSLFNIMKQLRNAGRQQKMREHKCKCAKGKFCDPIFHLCRKKFSEGRTCMFQKQCGKRLRCQWGKCQKAKAGDPGTFCKSNSQCTGESCCRNTPGSFHLMCIPRQSEGAICGLKKDTFSNVLYIVKRSVSPSCAPCESGLKCADTGDSKHKRCVKMAYVETAADELEDGNPSNGLAGANDDDENSGDEESPSMPAPAPKKPKDEDIGDWNPAADSGDDNDDDEDDKNDSDDDKKDDDKKNDDEDDDGDGDDDDDDEDDDDDNDEAIPIKPLPKKKAKGKKGKSKSKDKST